jgi:hypothetical protein
MLDIIGNLLLAGLMFAGLFVVAAVVTLYIVYVYRRGSERKYTQEKITKEAVVFGIREAISASGYKNGFSYTNLYRLTVAVLCLVIAVQLIAQNVQDGNFELILKMNAGNADVLHKKGAAPIQIIVKERPS